MNAIEIALLKSEQQSIIFGDQPRRMDIAGLAQPWPKQQVAVAVHRNEPVEYVLAVLPPFAGYADIDPQVWIGDYDDSLSFAAEASWRDAGLHLVWLDFSRFQALSPEDLAGWLGGRLAWLRGRIRAPVLVADAVLIDDRVRQDAINSALQRVVGEQAGIRLLPRSEISAAMGAAYWNLRMKGVGATAISDKANVQHARQVGLDWLPAAIKPRLKAIVLDADNTLYEGVIGEDGAAGVVLTPGHKALQEKLVALRESGLLLALVSRNEPDDVEELFRVRDDFPLKREHFSAFNAGWIPKSRMIAAAAAAFNFGVDAMLFLDDNVGEIAETSAECRGLKTLHAASADMSLAALARYPGLRAWSADTMADLRADDIAARRQREELQKESIDPVAYLDSLKIELTYALNPSDRLSRLHEIANKTNQFVLSLARFGEAEVKQYVFEPDRACVAFALKDRLADAGNVGALYARREDGRIIVDELCVSCRALGRGVETMLIATAVNALLDRYGAEEAVFSYRTGPRNSPALDWLAGFANADLGEAGEVVLPAAHLRQKAEHPAKIAVHWEQVS